MKHHPKLCALSVVTLAMFAASTAFAHDPKEHDPKTPAQQRGMAADEFATLDKNSDGKLGKAEIPAKHAMAPHFTMLDTNKDGSLSQAEFARHHEMKAMDHGKTPDHQVMANFAVLDRNKDGMLGKAEVPAHDPLAAHFSMLDADKNGSLSKTEYARHHDGM